jgi:hypothetical protein
MAYLIDGNNLLGRIAPHELREKGGRDGLVVRLLAFQRVTRARVHLVFDEPSRRRPTPGQSCSPSIFPARAERDDVIHDMIERQTDRRRFFVVADQPSASRLRARLRPTSDVSPASLGDDHEGKKMRELEKRTEIPSSLEVRLWDEVFKSKP